MAPPITHPKFVPKLDLSPDDLESLTVTGLGTSCTPALLKTRWKQLATANIGVRFGSDNSRILTTNLFLLGKLHKSSTECTTVSAAMFWPGVNQNIEIRLPLDNLNIFPFDPSLQSGLVSSSTVKHFFDTGKDLPVSPEEFRAAGAEVSPSSPPHRDQRLWLPVLSVPAEGQTRHPVPTDAKL